MIEKFTELYLQHCLGIENLNSTADTIVANIKDQQSLIDMCAQTKILINCVGPVCKSKPKYYS